MNKQFQLLPNGETLAYVEQGSGPKTLVLIHGNLSSSVYFLPLFQQISKEIRIIAPDLRGFGDSSYVNRFDSLKELANDVYLLLSELKIQKAAVLGWSLGGGVAMEFAANYPNMVEQLILLNSTTHKGYPIFQKDAKMQPIFGKVYPTKAELALDPLQVKPVVEAIEQKNAVMMTAVYDYTIYTVKKPSKEDNKLYIQETLKQRCLVDADFALATLNMSADISFYGLGTDSMKNIKAKTLHVWGKDDKTVPEYMLHANVDALKHQSTVHIFEECGHSPLVDQIHALPTLILDFIAS
jgi:pimeloyl-ACP methyl ester carboxylesterase